MRVLISAYACEPGAGSEPGAGWEWTRAAALEHEVWLLARENNGPAIEAAIAAEPDLRITPVYLDLPVRVRFWKYWPGGTQLYYFLWQFLVWRKARALHGDLSFDVGHHLTFAVDWMPAGIAWVRGLNVVWGPVGGATNMPWRLWRWLGWRGVVAELVREVATRPARRLFGDPTAARATVVVAQNLDVAERFASATQIEIEPNVAVRPAQDRRPARSGHHAPVALFVGRLIPWKGLRLALTALAQPASSEWHLHVYGEGPERRAAESLIERLGLQDRVVFQGQQPREAIMAALHGADALLQPSLHDAAGWAVAEAVTAGCPVICLDLGGPLVLVAPTTGKVVAADDEAVESLAEALSEIGARSPETSEPCERWTAARLPVTIDSLYRRAGAGRVSEVMCHADH